MNIIWNLHPNAAQAILNILGDLPTKSGVFNLLQDLALQTQNQIALAGQNAVNPVSTEPDVTNEGAEKSNAVSAKKTPPLTSAAPRKYPKK